MKKKISLDYVESFVGKYVEITFINEMKKQYELKGTLRKGYTLQFWDVLDEPEWFSFEEYFFIFHYSDVLKIEEKKEKRNGR